MKSAKQDIFSSGKTTRKGNIMKKLAVSLFSMFILLISFNARSGEYSGQTIKIAVVTDVTGSWAESVGQGALIAAEMALDDFGGSVNGVPVEIIMVDHKHKKDKEGNPAATNIAKDLIAKDFDAITELSGSSTARPIYKYAGDKEIVTIVVGAGSSDFTSENCRKTGFHWSFDTFALTKGLGKVIAEKEGGGDKWFFIGLNGFVQAAVKDAEPAIGAYGAKVIGTDPYPWGGGETDFMPSIKKAKQKGANVIAIANAGSEAVAAIRQIHESGLFEEKGSIVSLLTLLQDIRQLGLYSSRGLQFVAPFYWNYDEKTREFSQRFLARHGAVPSAGQAAMYSSVYHYLTAVSEAGTDKGIDVANKMKQIPISKDDPFARNAKVRKDGRMVHDMYLVEVKAPEKSEEAWDYFDLIRVIPGDEAYRPLKDGKCNFITGSGK